MIGCYDNHFMMPLDCNECTFKTECSIYNELAEVRKEINLLKAHLENIPPAPPLPIFGCACDACEILRKQQKEAGKVVGNEPR